MNPVQQSESAGASKTHAGHGVIYNETLGLATTAREVPGNSAAHLVTRSTGEIVRARTESALAALPEPSVLVLDFAGTGIIDYSCADELVAKLISRLVGGEYGDRYIVLANINNEHRENIQVALERKELTTVGWSNTGGTRGRYLDLVSTADSAVATAVVSPDTSAKICGGQREPQGAGPGIRNAQFGIRNLFVLGSLNPHLRQALDLVMAASGITAKEIAKKLGIELNTAGTRLINIHKRRLVLRTERVLSVGGREFIYSPLL
jgi:DNA-binding NarL/FixJ family response regulator